MCFWKFNELEKNSLELKNTIFVFENLSYNFFRTFSYDESKAECMPVNIRALCEDESKFPKLNLFRSRNKCEAACLEGQGGLEVKVSWNALEVIT